MKSLDTLQNEFAGGKITFRDYIYRLQQSINAICYKAEEAVRNAAGENIRIEMKDKINFEFKKWK